MFISRHRLTNNNILLQMYRTDLNKKKILISQHTLSNKVHKPYVHVLLVLHNI